MEINNCNSGDELLRFSAADSALRVSVARTTALVDHICHLHGTDPTASVALGRLATAAALMSSLLKDDQRLALSVEGNGPLRKLQAEADACGSVRATVAQPQCGVAPRDGRYDVAAAVGKAGFLQVIKDLGLKEPYRGMVQLVSSEIGEDIAWYFTNSEQIPTAVGLGVELDKNGAVAASGGYLIQAMPNADSAAIERVEGNIAANAGVSALLRSASTLEEMVAKLLDGLEYKLLGQTQLSFSCRCSRRFVLAMLTAMSAQELREMCDNDGGCEVECHYCRQKYHFSATELADIIAVSNSGNN